MNGDQYVVKVFDHAGQYSETSCTSFEHCLSVVALMRRSYPGKVVLAFNLDLCDYDFDGLTEDELRAVDEVA